jgi:hypothetical protein
MHVRYRIREAGADVMFMNKNTAAGRTMSVTVLRPCSDTVRFVAQQRKVPLFDR